MEGIFFELTVIVTVSAVLTIIFRSLKQPSILAYIVTGILLGPLGFFHIQNIDAHETLGQLGITLLLFMLGLELKLTELRSIGKTAIIAGTLQMWFTFFVGFFLSLALGVDKLTAIYLGIALSFSSTIIIVKLFSDKKELNSLHGKISIGILLMQDLFAVLAIIFFTNAKNGVDFSFSPTDLILLFVKILLLFGIVIFVGKSVFPRLIHSIAKSHESLFLFSLAWVFSFAAFVSSPIIGFSIEIGGFLAGLALANTSEHFQIVAKMKALRDFFITIFFVMLGFEMSFVSTQQVLIPAVILSIFVIVFKPLLIMEIVGFLGYRKRTSFLVGTSLGQVSEFSLIILFLGNQKGVIGNDIVTTVVLVSIISFASSTYIIQSAKSLYKRFENRLHIFEQKGARVEATLLDHDGDSELNDHIVLIGAEQMGQSIINSIDHKKERLLVVDFNPDVVHSLKSRGVRSFYGDIADIEIQDRAGLKDAKLVISTVSDVEDNLLLIEGMNHINRKAKIVVMALNSDDARTLYNNGADYVILPHLAGGRHVARLLRDDFDSIESFKEKDMKDLAR